ncbi:hypothetical protein [Streptomyces sp. NPDC004783]|uniref:hypothetical protein n=1 Tax=unclassified Streptomyces TaxID=2593676 RepID=UPI0033AA298D
MENATTWGLVVETTVGTGERKHTETHVAAHVTGTRQEALAELERRARSYVPAHPLSHKRRRLLRAQDGAILLVVDGAWRSYLTRFTVAELLEDSDAPAPEPVVAGEPAAPAAEPPVDRPAELDPDGVPVRPAWLGRSDLP